MAELTPQVMDALLASLGGTADEVAASLRARGIKGIRGEPRCCPLANLLAAEFPGHHYAVAPYRLVVEIDGEGRAKMPRACGDFGISFDHRRYPDLEGANVPGN